MILRTAALNFSLGLVNPPTALKGMDEWDLENLDRSDFWVFLETVLASDNVALAAVNPVVVVVFDKS